MNQRTAGVIAAALTAFVLVLVGGLAARLTRDAGAAPTAAAVSTATAPAALDPSVEALIREREAAYQQALAEADARLQAANAQIARAGVAQAQAAAAPAAAPAAAAPSYAVAAEQARAIALSAAPGAAALATPELVSYAGTPAYEVRLDRGLVYVDAQSGAVLQNGAAQPAPAPAVAGDDDEHEEHDEREEHGAGGEHDD